MPLTPLSQKTVLLTLLFYLITATPGAAQLVAPNGAKKIDGYVTSWIGNSYGGLNNGKGQWVQQDIAAMCVTPDGTVYTNVPWEEAGGNCMMYKDGEMLGAAMHTHGWGFNGGKAVAVNDKYVYIALSGNNEGGGLNDPGTWPPKGKRWFGVSRRLRSDFTQGAPFDHGKGGKGDTLPRSFQVVNEVPDANNIDGSAAITGLWATNERLYVANPLENRIEIYDAETMRKSAEWPLPDEFKGKMGAIAMSPDGDLWVLVQQPWDKPIDDRFLVFDKDGKLFVKKTFFGFGEIKHASIVVSVKGSMFPALVDIQPSAFCFDSKGQLLVADSGTFQTILIFRKIRDTYIHVSSFSETGDSKSMIGMQYNVKLGLCNDLLYSDLMFRNITAIACDAQDNVYIASDWATNGGGTILESYAPVDEPVITHLLQNPFPSYWKLNWRLYGLCFIDCATLDPDDETIVYTKEERYKIDWSQEPGEEWSFLGSTADRLNANIKTLRSPSDGEDKEVGNWSLPLFRDPRLNISDSGPVWVRNLNGMKFLFVGDMNAARLQVYEFDFDRSDEFAYIQPLVLFSPTHYKNRDGNEPTDWMPAQPTKGEWIWTNRWRHDFIDMEEPEEFSSQETEIRGIEGWWVDSKGDVWQTSLDKGLRRFRYQSDHEKNRSVFRHSPPWNFENLDIYPHPKEFTQVKRIRYDAETDTLYLGGCATVDGVEHKNQHWKPMGAVICRYDHFLQGDNPGQTDGKLRWRIVAPYVTGSSGHESCEPMGFDIAGDYMFVPYTGASRVSGFKTGHVEVFRISDGGSVGWMEPDPATVGEVGLQDIRECLSAHRRENGEYVVFLEDDYKAKVVMFRWMPGQKPE